MEEILRTFGEIAGIGGLSLGVFLILFKKISLPTGSKKHLTLFMWLVWSLALIGILTYVVVIIFYGKPNPILPFEKILRINYISEPVEVGYKNYMKYDLFIKNDGNVTIHELLVRVFPFTEIDKNGPESCKEIAYLYTQGFMNIGHEHGHTKCTANLIPKESFSTVNRVLPFTSGTHTLTKHPEPQNSYIAYRISELVENHKFHFSIGSAHYCGIAGIEAQIFDENGIVATHMSKPKNSERYERIYPLEDVCYYSP